MALDGPRINQSNREFQSYCTIMNKTKQYGTTMSTDVLAYRLLKSANLSETHEQLARATINKI